MQKILRSLAFLILTTGFAWGAFVPAGTASPAIHVPKPGRIGASPSLPRVRISQPAKPISPIPRPAAVPVMPVQPIQIQLLPIPTVRVREVTSGRSMLPRTIGSIMYQAPIAVGKPKLTLFSWVSPRPIIDNRWRPAGLIPVGPYQTLTAAGWWRPWTTPSPSDIFRSRLATMVVEKK